MKKEEKLIDELLKEHAKGGDDQQFLDDVEQGISEDFALANSDQSQTGKNRGIAWYLRGGVAATLVASIGGMIFWNTAKKEDTLAYQEVADVKTLTRDLDDTLPSFKTKEDALIVEEKVGKKVEKILDTPTNIQKENISNKPAQVRKELESSKTSKAIAPTAGESTTIPLSSPSPEVAFDSLSLDFDESHGFGTGWAGKAKKNKKEEYRFRRSTIPESSLSERGRVKDSLQGDASNMPQKPGSALGCIVKPKRNDNLNDKYTEVIENGFIAPVDELSSLSTFAVDVDTASYANIRRLITEGSTVPPHAVRIEEMVNYFDYKYPQPNTEHPFSVSIDSIPCPWQKDNQIVRIGIQGKELIRQERPDANLVFLLDVSGSMNSSDKLPLLKKSMHYLLEEMTASDTVSIVVYAGSSGLALPPTKMNAIGKKKVSDTMDKLNAGGSTAGGQGIKLAYKVAKEQFKKDGVNRIILATDGDFNVGVSGDEALTTLVKNNAKDGTYISVLGFGRGNLNDSMMEKITNNGNGNYSYIDTLKEGRKVLLEDMMGTLVTIAKDVKIQVAMNPNKVKAYRLIGYSNRALKAEDFLNKKIDAGEIGSGHKVTALYEIIPFDGKPYGKAINAERYFKPLEKAPNPALKDSDETLFVKLAYKKPDQKTNDESTYFSKPFTHIKNDPSSMNTEFNDIRFASSVALFGMLLTNSEYTGDATLEDVINLAKSSKGTDGKGYREEFINLATKHSKKHP